MFTARLFVLGVLGFVTTSCQIHVARRSFEESSPPLQESSSSSSQQRTIVGLSAAKQSGMVSEASIRDYENMIAQQEEMNRNHNIDVATKDRQDTCSLECEVENYKRRNLYDTIKRLRAEVRSKCRYTGTRFPWGEVITTEPNSTTAKDRIVNDEGTGKLERRHGRIDVVTISPEWVCPRDSDPDMKEVAKNWMRDMPKNAWVHDCSRIDIRKSREFANLPLTECLRWVKDE